MSGELLSEGLRDQTHDVIRWARLQRNSANESRQPLDRKAATRFPPRACILNEALPPATHALQPTKAKATLVRWDATAEQYREFEDDPLNPDAGKLTVFNHSENSNHGANTFGAALLIDGHYWFIGDCSAMATREPPTA